MTEASDLVGSFVIEVGVRQAWPFLTFCDNRTTPSTEVRLYIESGIEVTPTVDVVPGDSLRTQWQALYVLNGLVVESVAVTPTFDLNIGLSTDASLTVFGDQDSEASQSPWWLGPP